jgi:UrcA family protein
MTKSHIAKWIVVGLLASAGFTANAATPSNEVPTIKVNYGDLDLQTDRDVKRLYDRIQRAAAQVCQASEGPWLVNRVFWSSWHACMNNAVGDAVRSVHNQQLNTYYLAKN